MEQFVMIVSDQYASIIQGYYPSFIKSKIKKQDFRLYSDYRWAITTLIDYVHNTIYGDRDDTVVFPVLKFREAVVQFEYDMTLYSEVHDTKRTVFENACHLAEDVEDLLNAMM